MFYHPTDDMFIYHRLFFWVNQWWKIQGVNDTHFLYHFNISLFSGNYFLDDDTTVVVSRDHIVRAGEHRQYYPEWSFSTTSFYKIRFHFTEYDCSRFTSSVCWVKIGNGHQVSDAASRMLHHYGGSPPRSDRISLSNTAWVQARASYLLQNIIMYIII